MQCMVLVYIPSNMPVISLISILFMWKYLTDRIQLIKYNKKLLNMRTLHALIFFFTQRLINTIVFLNYVHL